MSKKKEVRRTRLIFRENLLALLLSTNTKFNFIPSNLHTMKKLKRKQKKKRTHTQFAANELTRKLYMYRLYFSYCMTDSALFTRSRSLGVCVSIFSSWILCRRALCQIFPLADRAPLNIHRDSSSFDSCT